MRTQAQIILSELKSKFNISDEKIAIKMGVSAMTAYRWRIGKHEPSVTELKFLQRIFQGYKNARYQL